MKLSSSLLMLCLGAALVNNGGASTTSSGSVSVSESTVSSKNSETKVGAIAQNIASRYPTGSVSGSNAGSGFQYSSFGFVDADGSAAASGGAGTNRFLPRFDEGAQSFATSESTLDADRSFSDGITVDQVTGAGFGGAAKGKETGLLGDQVSMTFGGAGTLFTPSVGGGISTTGATVAEADTKAVAVDAILTKLVQDDLVDIPFDFISLQPGPFNGGGRKLMSSVSTILGGGGATLYLENGADGGS
eukprot:CAMPEP_0197482112 /NCGR_PEP_ID=MMETSP1309-20131121/51903_1 /TAXON_ID=464262 /ORGANISM="Genus nov. species nov., Strain RCC998" /LENGTH=245 /DNA_ID=CAMNT_0043024535 /DNA_START=163 /DNA_END=897 /DNA_ORIENTATION=+